MAPELPERAGRRAESASRWEAFVDGGAVRTYERFQLVPTRAGGAAGGADLE